DVARHLEAFLRDPDGFAHLGDNGRTCLEQYHAPERYADGLLRLCDEAKRYRPRAVSYYLAERAAGEMSVWAANRDDAGEHLAGHSVNLTMGPEAGGKRAA